MGIIALRYFSSKSAAIFSNARRADHNTPLFPKSQVL